MTWKPPFGPGCLVAEPDRLRLGLAGLVEGCAPPEPFLAFLVPLGAAVFLALFLFLGLLGLFPAWSGAATPSTLFLFLLFLSPLGTFLMTSAVER